MNKKVLILHSTADNAWKSLLDTHLTGLVNAGLPLETDYWNNSRITDDKKTLQELDSALQQAALIILLTSENLLESNLIQNEKIRHRLKIKQENGFPIFLLLIGKCGWKRFPWMKELPVFPESKQSAPERFLADQNPTAANNTLTHLTKRISDLLISPPRSAKAGWPTWNYAVSDRLKKNSLLPPTAA